MFGAGYQTADGPAFDVFSVDEHVNRLQNLTNTGVAFGGEWAPPPARDGAGGSVTASSAAAGT